MCQPEKSDWFLPRLDQKLENLREQAQTLVERFHGLQLELQTQDKQAQAALQKHHLDLKTLEQSLQYLSHKTQLQLKDSENKIEHFMQSTENKVQNVHHATREELSALARRVEIIEKLLF